MTRSGPRLDDLVIVLPGITGSVLQLRGRDVWALSGESIWGALKSAGGVLEQLMLDHQADDPNRVELDDGVAAHRVFNTVSILPGVMSIDGYGGILSMVESRFEVCRGSIQDHSPANLFGFPYDWRRDNRSSAQRLKEFIDERLRSWRAYVGNDDPKVILIAHSMGGLVARHYLEVLGGAENARALFTLGTPFRGAPKSLQALSHGVSKAWLDLSPLLRSFTSVYQLLPTYECIAHDQDRLRAAEAPSLPGIDMQRAIDALQFHRDIENAIERNPSGRYATLPIVGHRQPTVQSAVLANDALEMSRSAPSWIDEKLAGGDGTVPRVSAIPMEMSADLRGLYTSEKHGSIQADGSILDQLYQHLLTLSASGLGDIRGEGYGGSADTEPAVGLAVEHLFAADEPVTVQADLFNVSSEYAPTAQVVSASGSPREVPMKPDGDSWTVLVEGLDPGVYRIKVSAGTASAQDAFEVLP